jgi:cobaltochelatase CobN
MTKVVAVVWQSYYNMIFNASKNINELQINVYSARALDNKPEKLEKVLKEIKSAQLLFFYRSNESVWEEIERKIKETHLKAKVVCLGHDPSYWMLSNIEPEILSKAYKYLVINGEKNIKNMFYFLANKLLGLNLSYE